MQPQNKPLAQAILPAVLLFSSLLMPAAQAEVIHMDEIPYQSIDQVNIGIAHFNFSVDGNHSEDAYINAIGPGEQMFMDTAVLEGSTAGTLSVQFDSPVSGLSFGVALQSEESLSAAVLVSLWGKQNSLLWQQTLDLHPTVLFSEALFTSGQQGVIRLDVSFADRSLRFALDQLAFQPSPVPEPAAAWLLAVGGLILWFRPRRLTAN